MPPKKEQKQGSSSKVKDDKTFGLKNKNKSAKVQKQVQVMQEAQSRAGKNKAQLEKEHEKELRAKAKAEEEKRRLFDAEIFKPILPPQKVPPGVDPKSILCQYFKLGSCDKGKKCRFSHDPSVERKTQKRDIYSDDRDEKLDDTMDKWDEAKLRAVVLSKAGNPRTTTDIVCKYFIDAIEDQKFGWRWECPNTLDGKVCIYRHALPQGFVLKSQKKAADEAAKSNVISIEEFLEVERHKLGSNLTPVTPESFAKWKQNRMSKKEAEAEAMKKAKESQQAAGKFNGMSGRDLFSFNPDWFADDDDEPDDDGWDIAAYRKQRAAEDQEAEDALVAQFNEGFADVGSGGGRLDGEADEEEETDSESEGEGEGESESESGDDGQPEAGPSGSAS